jgi:tetratricopeptide (TPR) repeat protein
VIHAEILNARADRALVAGDAGGFLELLEEAARLFEEAGDRRATITYKGYIGYACIEVGAYDRAERTLREVIEAAGRLGLAYTEATARENLSTALAVQGRRGEALEQLLLALDHARRTGNVTKTRTGAQYLARLRLVTDDLGGAEEAAREAVALTTETQQVARASALATLGRVLLGLGRLDEAVAISREAFDTVATNPGALEEGEAEVHLVHAEALHAAGDAHGAAKAIAYGRTRLLERAAKIPRELPSRRAGPRRDPRACARVGARVTAGTLARDRVTRVEPVVLPADPWMR